jgi:urea transport system substrate-binding protein
MSRKMVNKMMYRFLVMLMGLSLIAGVVSCSAPSTPTAAPSSTPAPSSSSPASQSPSPTPSTLPMIKILGTMPFSGDAANIGPGYDRAVRMAVDELNAAGIPGFAGIDYKVIDTETKPSIFQQKLLREVQNWGPDLIIGAALETELRIPCQLCPQYKLPCVVGGHLSMSKYLPPGEVQLSKWVCYYGYSDYYCGYLAGQFFKENGAKKVAYVGGDYDWGYSNGMGLKAFWEQNGKPFELSPIIYTPLDKTDFSTEVQIIKDAKPDALYCAYMGAGWFSFPKQLRDAGAVPKYFLYDPTYSNMGGAKVTGAYGAENIYTLADHDPTSPAWAEFVQKWKAKYGKDAFPEAYTNNHYQDIYWFIEAVKKAGPQGLKDHELLIDTMHNTSFQNVCISPMGTLDAYGSNWGSTGAIIQFQPGAGLDPSFLLHEVLIKKVITPKLDAQQVLDVMKGLTKLEQGKVYPAGG